MDEVDDESSSDDEEEAAAALANQQMSEHSTQKFTFRGLLFTNSMLLFCAAQARKRPTSVLSVCMQLKTHLESRMIGELLSCVPVI